MKLEIFALITAIGSMVGIIFTGHNVAVMNENIERRLIVLESVEREVEVGPRFVPCDMVQRVRFE